MGNENEISRSAPAILAGLASELHMLVMHGLNIETALTGLSLRAADDVRLIENLQSLDLLLQHLSELRHFTAALSEAAAEEGTFDLTAALGGIKLQGLHARLAESMGRSPALTDAAPTGDFEFL